MEVVTVEVVVAAELEEDVLLVVVAATAAVVVVAVEGGDVVAGVDPTSVLQTATIDSPDLELEFDGEVVMDAAAICC